MAFDLVASEVDDLREWPFRERRYSMRATDVPSISTPIRWEEVDAAAADARAEGVRFTPAQVLERTGAAGDLFRPVLDVEQTLPSFRALRLG